MRDKVFFVGQIQETDSGYTQEKQTANFSLRLSNENQHVVMEMTDNQYVSVVYHDKEHYNRTDFMPLESNETFSAGFFCRSGIRTKYSRIGRSCGKELVMIHEPKGGEAYERKQISNV